MNTMSCEKHLGMGTVQNCAPCLQVELDYVRSEIEALRADVVWAVRGYIRPIDDGQRLAIGIDPQTLFTRMVEWDGTDADILRAVREAREK